MDRFPKKQLMRKLLIPTLFILTALFINSCGLYQDPEFEKISLASLPSISKRNITIKSNAHFKNPNPIGCKLIKTTLEVFVNGKPAGDINQTFSMEIPGNSSFKIPLNISFNPAKVINLKYLLSSGISSLLNKSLDVRYKGDIWLTIAEQNLIFHLDETEKISLKR